MLTKIRKIGFGLWRISEIARTFAVPGQLAQLV